LFFRDVVRRAVLANYVRVTEAAAAAASQFGYGWKFKHLIAAFIVVLSGLVRQGHETGNAEPFLVC
jgi:hypothetical protein